MSLVQKFQWDILNRDTCAHFASHFFFDQWIIADNFVEKIWCNAADTLTTREIQVHQKKKKKNPNRTYVECDMYGWWHLSYLHPTPPDLQWISAYIIYSIQQTFMHLIMVMMHTSTYSNVHILFGLVKHWFSFVGTWKSQHLIANKKKSIEFHAKQLPSGIYKCKVFYTVLYFCSFWLWFHGFFLSIKVAIK